MLIKQINSLFLNLAQSQRGLTVRYVNTDCDANIIFCHIDLTLDYCKFIIELQALGMIGTSCKLAPAGASLQLVPNSKFIIPFALFRAHYRLKKCLFLWWVKGNRFLFFLYFTDCKVVIISTTLLIHYRFILSRHFFLYSLNGLLLLLLSFYNL